VLDASAVVAYVQQEKGRERVVEILHEGPCWMTTVNTCEVLSKLCENGMPLEEAHATLDDLGLVVVAFDEELAYIAASLRVRTRHIGASLGDRACLALAQHAAKTGTATVCTADKAWASIRWPFKMMVIR
jgi:PIN domain nuclease of toxin-antitoxin system